MWMDNEIFKKDLEYINSVDYIDWSKFNNKTFFITGSTGLIGYAFVCALAYHNQVVKAGIKIIALVRDIALARKKFNKLLNDNSMQFIAGDIEHIPMIKEPVDYIMHAAAPTDSAFFVEHPVETINTIVDGTRNILELAKYKNAEMVFLSTMEVYGAPQTEILIDEKNGIDMDSMIARSSYPYAKRLAECLCCGYAEEYGVKVKVARLAQTFGPGVSQSDNRIFAEFARCVKHNEDIVLFTDGKSKRMYLYTMDAVGAILCILQKGVNCQAYNVANKKTYCSIREMAEVVAHKIANDTIKVIVNNDNDYKKKYPPNLCLNLDLRKIDELGWKPFYEIDGSEYRNMFVNMINSNL